MIQCGFIWCSPCSCLPPLRPHPTPQMCEVGNLAVVPLVCSPVFKQIVLFSLAHTCAFFSPDSMRNHWAVFTVCIFVITCSHKTCIVLCVCYSFMYIGLYISFVFYITLKFILKLFQIYWKFAGIVQTTSLYPFLAAFALSVSLPMYLYIVIEAFVNWWETLCTIILFSFVYLIVIIFY